MTFDELHKLITQGEGGQIEFKRELSEDVVRGLSTDVCAFANSRGGRIVFGVTDDREPVGCVLSGTEKNRISQAASESRPAVKIDIEEVPFGKKTFLVVTIPSSGAVHNDKERRFPVRIGNITDYLDSSGLVMLLQERSLIGSQSLLQSSPAPDRKREPMLQANVELMLRALKSKNGRVRIEGLMDLATTMNQYCALEDQKIADLVGLIIQSGSNDEMRFVLDVARYAEIWGSSEEKGVVDKWLEGIVDAAKSSPDPQVAARAFEVVVYARSTAAVDILSGWILSPDDAQYASRNPTSLLQNVGHYGLKEPIRAGMYGILETSKDELTTKRVSEVLEALRRSYG